MESYSNSFFVGRKSESTLLDVTVHSKNNFYYWQINNLPTSYRSRKSMVSLNIATLRCVQHIFMYKGVV